MAKEDRTDTDDEQSNSVKAARASTAQEAQTSITGKLVGAMGRNINVMGNLLPAIASLHKAQGDFSKVLISTGNKQLGGVMQLHKTFDSRGLSLQEAIGINTAILESGLQSYDKNTRAITDQKSAYSVQKKLLSEYSNLGKDTKGLAQLMAANQQTLGISTAQTAALTEHTIALGATYGFNSDKLIGALNALSKTWVDSAGTFGSQVTLAGQTAISTMMAEYGPAAAGQIQNLANTLLNGSKEASVTAAKLNIDLGKLFSTNASEVHSALKQGLVNLNKFVGDSGSKEAGFFTQDLAAALGANPGMLALSKMEPLTRKMVKTSLAKQAEDARRNNALASINEAVKNIIITLLPAIKVLAIILQGIAKVMDILKYQVSLILLYMVTKKLGQMAKGGGMSSMMAMMTMGMMGKKKGAGVASKAAAPVFANAAAKNKAISASVAKQNIGNTSWKGAKMNKAGTKPDMRLNANKEIAKNRAAKAAATKATRSAVVGTVAKKATGGIIVRLLGRVVGWFFGWPAMIALMILPSIFSMFSSSKKDSNDNAKKTHELLDKPKSKQEMHLASIVRTLNQNNIYQEQLLLQSEESATQLKIANDPKPIPPSRTFNMPNRGNI